jgi:hypothetical protein
MLLFDGTCSPTCGGMWIERDGRWHERPLPRPLERMGGGFAWDPAVHGSLLFGGFGDSFGSGDMNDTWIWTGSRWRVVQQNVQPGGTGPPVRQYPAMAYDARSNRMVLFGGSGAAYPDPELGDTWTFDGSGWTQIAPPVAPAPRYDHVMATNPGGGVVLFGGYGKDGLLGDTWIERDGAWSDVQPASSPPARYWAAMAYDQRMKQVVLFGGGATGGVSMGDTWLWDGRTWTQANPPVAPTARLGATMTYDPATGEVWLFGGAGCGPAVCEITNDVWTWDGSTWTRQVATSGPGARWFADCAPSRGGGIALFGGQGGGSSLPMSEMWRWDGPSQTGPARSARSVG